VCGKGRVPRGSHGSRVHVPMPLPAEVEGDAERKDHNQSDRGGGFRDQLVTAKVTSTITAEPMARTGSQLRAPVSWRTRKWPADTRANTFWVSYGALIGQPAMCLSAGFGLACAIVTCVILRARRTVPPVAALAGLRPAVAVSPPLRRHPAGLCPAA
jgi:hypothetical protein